MPDSKRSSATLPGDPLPSTSYSELSTFVHCPLQHLYRYHLRLVTRRYSEKRALVVGSITHDSIDLIYQAMRDEGVEAKDWTDEKVDEVVDKAASRFVNEYKTESNKPYGPNPYEWGVDLCLARELVGVFVKKVLPKEKYRIVETEWKFEVEMAGRLFLGFVDAVYENEEGEIFVGEVKTWAASRSVTKLLEHASKDLQTDLYLFPLSQDPRFEGRVAGKVYTIYRKPPSNVMSPKKHDCMEDHVEAIRAFYRKSKATLKRVEVRGVPDREAIEQRVQSMVNNINAFYSDPYKSASRYTKGHPDYYPCGFCEYRGLCHKNQQVDPSFRYKKRRGTKTQ